MKACRRGVGRDPLVKTSASGHPADDPGRTVAIESLTVGPEEDRPLQALADGQVDGPGRPGGEGDRHDISALARDGQRPMSSLEAQGLDVGSCCLRDPQPIQDEQRDESVVLASTESGRHEQGSDLVAIERRGKGLIVEPGSAHMDGG